MSRACLPSISMTPYPVAPATAGSTPSTRSLRPLELAGIGWDDMLTGTSVRAGRNRREVISRCHAARCKLSGHRRLDFLFVYVEIGVDVLDVIVIFQRLDHSQHLLRLRPGQLDVVLRHEGNFSGRRGDSSSNESLADFFHGLGRRGHFPEGSIIAKIF